MTPADERSDADLLAAHVEGDPDAFGTLFARHRDRLWAVALRTSGNPDDAADGLQDGLISAYRRAGSFRGEAAVTTWLHRVVVNACLDRMRASRVRRVEPLPDDLDERGDRGWLPGRAAGAGSDPADAAEAEERRRLVVSALARLPSDQRAALVLVDMEGWSTAEAAQALDCPVGTVKSRCSRGRTRLAVLLGVLDPGREAGHGRPGNPQPGPAVPSPEPRGPPGST
jgi:RNA polymerase sigma-70 factor (ECF subfamily)